MNIDNEVAEKVMRWHTHKYSGKIWSDGKGCVAIKEHYKPSANITQAFNVVEKMRERGHSGILIENGGGLWAYSYYFSGYETDDGMKWVFRTDKNTRWCKTPAKAICLAALKAVEE